MTALTFHRLYQVSVISQVCIVGLSKCTKVSRKLGIGRRNGICFTITRIGCLVVCICYDLVNFLS